MDEGEKRLTLPYEEPYSDTTQIEPIQPLLYALPDPPCLLLPLPLQHALRNSSHRRIVPLFNILKQRSERFVVVVHFWRVLQVPRRRRKVSPFERYAEFVRWWRAKEGAIGREIVS